MSAGWYRVEGGVLGLYILGETVYAPLGVGNLRACFSQGRVCSLDVPSYPMSSEDGETM